MAKQMWLAVDKDGKEIISEGALQRVNDYWDLSFEECGQNDIPHVCAIKVVKGSIEKLAGKKLTWKDEPVCIKDFS